MNRYLFDKAHGVMATVGPDGSVTFHDATGRPVQSPPMTQEETVTMLRGRGYVEAPL